MAYINTISPDDSASEVRAMYERQQAAFGYVPNFAKVFCHRPETMTRWGKLLAEIKRPVDSRRFELITFAAAYALRSSYCSLAHGEVLTQYLSKHDICTLATTGTSPSITIDEHVVMEFARKVATDATSIESADIDKLKNHGLSDEDIFDVIAIVAARAFFTKILDSLGAKPDAAYALMDNALKSSLTHDTPIDNQATESIASDALPTS